MVTFEILGCGHLQCIMRDSYLDMCGDTAPYTIFITVLLPGWARLTGRPHDCIDYQEYRVFRGR